MPREVTGGLGDQHDHGEVIEEFKRTDHALAGLLAVRAGRLPQGAAKPVPARTARSSVRHLALPSASEHFVRVRGPAFAPGYRSWQDAVRQYNTYGRAASIT